MNVIPLSFKDRHIGQWTLAIAFAVAITNPGVIEVHPRFQIHPTKAGYMYESAFSDLF